MVPRSSRTVYTILAAVEFLQEGHRAQQHIQADEPQQQAACMDKKVKLALVSSLVESTLNHDKQLMEVWFSKMNIYSAVDKLVITNNYYHAKALVHKDK